MLRDTVLQLEQLADEAMDACRRDGNIDASVRDAVQKAHREMSQAKKDLMAHS